MSELIFPSVDKRLLPQVIFAEFPRPELIDDVEEELTRKAQLDPDQCYGFFPDNRSQAIDHDLPMCQYFAQAHPILPYDDELFYFSWLRLSLVDHRPIADGFHLDGNSSSGLGEQQNEPSAVRGFRAVINLGSTPRFLRYSTQDPSHALRELTEAGHTTCYPLEETTYTWELSPRQGNLASGVIFCATHVMHTGDSSGLPHFLLSYGRDETVA